jgi:hypothetical protein
MPAIQLIRSHKNYRRYDSICHPCARGLCETMAAMRERLLNRSVSVLFSANTGLIDNVGRVVPGYHSADAVMVLDMGCPTTPAPHILIGIGISQPEPKSSGTLF